MNKVMCVLMMCFLASCGHYSDGTSVWSGQMWLAPAAFFGLAGMFFYMAYRSSKSGSLKNPLYTGGKKEEGGNVPIYQLPVFWFGVVCFVASLIIIWAVNAEI